MKEDDTGKVRTCHCSCERYAEFQEYNEKKKAENRRIGDANSYSHCAAERVKRKVGWYTNKDRR